MAKSAGNSQGGRRNSHGTYYKDAPKKQVLLNLVLDRKRLAHPRNNLTEVISSERLHTFSLISLNIETELRLPGIVTPGGSRLGTLPGTAGSTPDVGDPPNISAAFPSPAIGNESPFLARARINFNTRK